MTKITISDYLIQELNKIGIKDFFGLPGDYNFNIINSIQNNPSTNWIGCTNELNAGYAADGYARVNGYGALVTTYNVGELSALNAVAGSFAENVPVISIVGLPCSYTINNELLVHHNFIKPDYATPYEAYFNTVQAAAVLYEKNAKSEIDRVLSVFIKEKKPVYIAIPSDVCTLTTDNDSGVEIPKSDEKELHQAIEHAVNLIEKADRPVIIGDCLIERFGAVKEFKELVEIGGMPAVSFVMGKGLIDESCPDFLGTYLGSHDNINVYNAVNNSDCVISAGTIYGDFNTFRFDIKIKPYNFIEIQGVYTIIENKIYKDVLMKDFLQALIEKIKDTNFKKNTAATDTSNNNNECEFALNRYQDPVSWGKKKAQEPENEYLSHCGGTIEKQPLNLEYISHRLEEFLKPGDRIFTDTGILSYLVSSMQFPDNCISYMQLLWCSIGWATPAVFGAGMADKSKRMILLTGEGSHQLTFQELSNIVYRGLKPIIFVLNNSGYTIERVLSKNANSSYNNIIPWDYTKLFEAFDPNAYTKKVKTNLEFDEVLDIIERECKNRICYIELFTNKLDLPVLMKKIYNKG